MMPNIKSSNNAIYFTNDFIIPLGPFGEKSLLELALTREAYLKFKSPSRGSIIIAKVDIRGKKKNICKRVIGLPGDLITIRNNEIYVNREKICVYKIIGEEVKHLSVMPDGFEFYIEDTRENYGNTEFIVPHDSVFCLGDNRATSFDSRSPMFRVKLTDIVGIIVLLF